MVYDSWLSTLHEAALVFVALYGAHYNPTACDHRGRARSVRRFANVNVRMANSADWRAGRGSLEVPWQGLDFLGPWGFAVTAT